MSVSPVNGNKHVQSQEPVVKPQPAAHSAKKLAPIPEDSVKLSPAAKAQPTRSSADVDRDGDSK
jgi:hypothetical protein